MCGAALWARYQPQIFPPHLRREPVAQARLQRQVHAPARAVQRTVQHLRHFDAVAVLRTAKKMHLYVFFASARQTAAQSFSSSGVHGDCSASTSQESPVYSSVRSSISQPAEKPAQTCRS